MTKRRQLHVQRLRALDALIERARRDLSSTRIRVERVHRYAALLALELRRIEGST